MEFAYINGDDPENIAPNTAEKRKEAKRELPKNYYRSASAKKGDYVSGDGTYYDASGYIVNPKRYLDRLRDVMKANASKHIQKAYDRIMDIQDSISNAIRDIDDPLDSTYIRSIADVVKTYQYSYMLDNYNRMMSYLKAAEGADSESKKNDYLTQIFERGGTLDSFNRYADYVEKALSKYTKAVVDWDNPE